MLPFKKINVLKTIMDRDQYYSTAEAAQILGVSRITVFKRIKSGKIPAELFGHAYFIPKQKILEISGKVLTDQQRTHIEDGVHKVVTDYGDVLRRLGKE